ncbi:MAG TPA: DUF4123 domain-containing protein [Polyangia bacterium]|nr:DUF4123 domain-containing protein [Polyangia bacterium]
MSQASPESGLAERVLDTLWRTSTASLYAVLDGARDEEVQPFVARCGLSSACLYDGYLEPELEAVAPYLVALERGAPATLELIRQAWGHQLGIFIEAPGELSELRRHLRRFLLVTDPQRRRLLFRYYDPRVLRVYLPTCTAEELERFFGPIHYFHAEGGDAGVLLRFAGGLAGLVTEEVRL